MAMESNAFWTDPQVAENPSDAELTMAARSMIVARRALAEHLSVDLIHDTALDVLLALFVARVEHRPVTEATLANGATVGRAVLLRWLRALASDGMIALEDAADEGGARGVALSAHGMTTVAATIAAVIRSQAVLYAD